MASIEQAVIHVYWSSEQLGGMLNGFVSFTRDEQQVTPGLQ